MVIDVIDMLAGSTELPVAAIRRPLQRTRSNNQEKVQALMESIEVRGLVEPIDVLEVDGEASACIYRCKHDPVYAVALCAYVKF